MLILDIQEPHYSFIKNGQKKVEWRLGKEKYFLLQKGDNIQVNDIEVVLVDVRKYTSFREMLEFEWVRNVIPNAKNIEEAIAVYRQYYSKDDEAKYGVAAIEIKI